MSEHFVSDSRMTSKMKFSYNWLKELVQFKQTPKELGDLINLHITEIESISSGSDTYNSVIVGEILEINSHPNADKLRLVKLDVGRGKKIEVVCGASNVEIGQKVPLALIGSKLSGREIKPVIIRGIKSDGMICSAAELGLEAKSDGIMELAKTASVGRPVNEVLSLDENVILDIKVLSNRPDYLSYMGLARDISAVLGTKWISSIKTNYKESADISTKDKVAVSIKDKLGCSYYSARFVSNVNVSESPKWIKDKLISAGLRSINNLVDISNLVMLETGQPIHIFDANKVNGKKIIVRKAQAEETIISLDKAEIKLTPEILLIADNENPIAIAGIMGGYESGVTDLTRDIVVEVATFNPSIIRRGAKIIGLSTDASLRFERGLSPYLALNAMNRIMHLINQIMPESIIAKGAVEQGKNKIAPITISFNAKEIAAILGTDINAVQIVSILKNLGFTVAKNNQNIKAIVPPFRLDIRETSDIAEEIVRIMGIDKIDSKMPYVKMLPPTHNYLFKISDQIKDFLAKAGFNEVISHSFIGKDWANKLRIPLDSDLKLINPLNSYWTYLVSALWPNLLKFAASNQPNDSLFFEINTVFKSDDTSVLPKEKLQLALVANLKNKDSYRVIKGIMQSILESVDNLKFVFIPSQSDDYYINIVRIMSDKHLLGSIEGLSPSLAGKIDVPKGTVFAYLDVNLLLDLTKDKIKKFIPFSYFPTSTFDLSVELPVSSAVGNLIDDIKDKNPLVVDVNVFDIYKLKNSNRSVGLRVTLQSHERTLIDSEIRQTESKIINLITTQYRGKIRGSGS